MPIYEYRRPDGSTFEVMQSFSDEPLKHDPETGVEVQRVLHAPAVHFKGKGFYNTDYGTRKRQRENAASSESASSSSSDSAGEGAAGKDGGSGGEASSNGKSAETSKGEGKGKGKGEASAAKGSKSERVAAKS